MMKAEAMAVMRAYEDQSETSLEAQILDQTEVGKINALEAPYEPDIAPPEMWTPEHVGKRLVEAVRTSYRLPPNKGPRSPGNHWPEYQYEWPDRLAWEELPPDEKRARDRSRLRTIVRPSSEELRRMDVCWEWLRAIYQENDGLFRTLFKWANAKVNGKSVTELCDEQEWAYSTFYRRLEKAQTWIADWLNASARPVF